ncbi:hypothetical protein D3C73_1475440 [compost metagenome]
MLSWLQGSAAPDIETADPLRAVDFVSGEAHIIHWKPLKSNRQQAKHLYSIDMEQDAALSG